MIRHIIYYLLIIGFATSSLAQKPVYHFDSDQIIHKNVEYFGTLSKPEVKSQVKGTRQLNFNPVVSFNGVNDHLKIDEKIYVNLAQMTAITVFEPSLNTQKDRAIWELSSNEPTIALSTTNVVISKNEIQYEGLSSNDAVIHTYKQYFKKNNRHFSNWLNTLNLGNKTHSENSLQNC